MTPLASCLTPREIHDRLVAAHPPGSLDFLEGRIPSTLVERDGLVAVALLLRDAPDLAFDYPASITAIDYFDYFEIVYQLRSMRHRHDVTLKCRVDRDDAVLPSVVEVWPGADFQEREIWDLMGVVFEGHPNLTRILLWDEFEGHPLRKDFGIPAPMPPEIEEALRRGIAGAGVDAPASAVRPDRGE